MLIIVDNTAWPEALLDENWTPEKLQESKSNGGEFTNTVEISVYTVFPG